LEVKKITDRGKYMDKLEVILSFISHEQLSLSSANPHPLFNNLFYNYNGNYLSTFVPLKDLCHSIYIPAWLCWEFDPDLFFYESIKEYKIPTLSAIKNLPDYRESIFKIEIRPAEDICEFDNIIPSIHIHNVLINIGQTVSTYIITIPRTDKILTISCNNDTILPNYENIKAWSEFVAIRNIVNPYNTEKMIAGNTSVAGH
jgi:hypothetical protein